MFESLRERLAHLRPASRSDASDPSPALRRDIHDLAFGHERMAHLRALHASLLRAFEAVLESNEQREFGHCLTRLRDFDQRLQEYLSNEDAEFHAAMSVYLEGDADRLLLLRSLRARLRQLKRQVHELAWASMNDQPVHAPRADFGIAFQSMAKTLRSCLDLEETGLLPFTGQGADMRLEAAAKPERSNPDAWLWRTGA